MNVLRRFKGLTFETFIKRSTEVRIVDISVDIARGSHKISCDKKLRDKKCNGF